MFSEASRNSSKNGLEDNGLKIVSIEQTRFYFKGGKGPEKRPPDDSVPDNQEERRAGPRSTKRRRHEGLSAAFIPQSPGAGGPAERRNTGVEGAELKGEGSGRKRGREQLAHATQPCSETKARS